jgi:hypothetical protein
VLRGAATGLAGLVVLFALVGPNELGALTPTALLRVPVEGLVLAGLVLVLPARGRRRAAVVIGALLGLFTVLKVLDMGFLAAFGRPFDPLLDWTFLGPAVEFVARSAGRAVSVAAAAGAVLLAVGAVGATAWAARRLTRVAAGHRLAAGRTLAVLGVVWVVCAVAGLPVASASAAGGVAGEVRQVRADLADRRQFAAQSRVDAFRDVPGSGLLTALRGRDVIVAFVESYGRVALDDPQVTGVLDAGERGLGAAGFGARSAFAVSPTAGGGSWLAHSTLQSGLWIDNQRRYADLLDSDRLTLSGAFHRAGWRTVGIDPANYGDWPEGAFYDFDRIYDARTLGYNGPTFAFDSIPDQFTLAAFQRAERPPGTRRPVMAEIDLLSSHAPWRPLPPTLSWDALGDGSAYTAAAGAHDAPESVLRRDAAQVRADYGASVAYSLASLISYVRTFGDENLVLILLGDHQPAPVVPGAGDSHDAPVTIVAADAVLDRISGWGWQDGMTPGPRAPAWRMDAFRDRFLTAFGPPSG